MKAFPFLLALLLFSAELFAGDIFFKTSFTLWSDPDILLWSPDSANVLDPKEFSLSLKRNNSGIGNPSTRIAGEWERDSNAALYANWLRNNLEPKVPAENLKARDPAVQRKIASIEDRLLLFATRRGNSLVIALFDETSFAPKIAGSIPYREDKVQLGDDIAAMFFGGSAKRRLSAEERKRKAVEPDEYFSEIPKFHGWAGIAGGYTQAQIPFTPDSWYRSHLKSRIKNYRNTKDSLST